MVHKAVARFVFLAATLSLVVAARNEVRSTRTLLCPVCPDGCSKCVCGKCLGCGWGYHPTSAWNKECVPDCKKCHVSHCSDCDCDGHCKWCNDGYELHGGYCEKSCKGCNIDHCGSCDCYGVCEYCYDGYDLIDGWCEKIHYVEPSKKPEPVHYEPDYGWGGNAKADADAHATGPHAKTKTKTNTHCDGYSCSASSSSRSRSG